MQLWGRDESVRSYAYFAHHLRQCDTTWRRRRNQEKMYSATWSTSAQRRYAAPAHGSPRALHLSIQTRFAVARTSGLQAWQPTSQDVSATIFAETRITSPLLTKPRSGCARAA